MNQENEVATYYDVVGIGNAIVDVLAKVGDRFLMERDLPKGCMTLLNAQDAGKIYADIVPECQVSGGSAANTVAGIASLGGAPAFIGKGRQRIQPPMFLINQFFQNRHMYPPVCITPGRPGIPDLFPFLLHWLRTYQ